MSNFSLSLYQIICVGQTKLDSHLYVPLSLLSISLSLSLSISFSLSLSENPPLSSSFYLSQGFAKFSYNFIHPFFTGKIYTTLVLSRPKFDANILVYSVGLNKLNIILTKVQWKTFAIKDTVTCDLNWNNLKTLQKQLDSDCW